MRLVTFSFLRNCKYKPYSNFRQSQRTHTNNSVSHEAPSDSSTVNICTGDQNLIEVDTSWLEYEEVELRNRVLCDMRVIPDFITEKEETALLAELEPQLKRMRYEFDHWDNAIQGYRETERGQWNAENVTTISRLQSHAITSGGGPLLPLIHVLDLAAAGHIKPHVDAVRFCGEVIAGISLLSSAIMRLQHNKHPNLIVDALLPQRSLYIMRGVARYDFTHAVLGTEQSVFRGERVQRGRRIAVICRSAPSASDHADPL